MYLSFQSFKQVILKLELTHFLNRMKNTCLFPYSTNIVVRLLFKNKELYYPKTQKMCDPILVTLLKMRPHYSQSSRENATPSSGTSPLGSYKKAPPPPLPGGAMFRLGKHEFGSEIWMFEAKLRQEDNGIWKGKRKGKVRCVLPPPRSHAWDPTIIDFVRTAIKME